MTRNWTDKAGKLWENFCSVVLQVLTVDLLSLSVIEELPADLSLVCLLMCYRKKSFDKVQYSHLCVILLQAAGRHQCSYLISLQKQEFLLQGGDHTWLKGLSRIPQKLRDLYEINKILAHRPWLLTKSHIEVKTIHLALVLHLSCISEKVHVNRKGINQNDIL